jgi:GNAT superfamily N-acetyltransferase
VAASTATTVTDFQVSRIDREHEPQAVALLACAFDRDPVSCIAAPDARQRAPYLRYGIRLLLDAALPHGHVFGAYEDGRLRGVAIWLPPGAAAHLLPGAVRRLRAVTPLLPHVPGVVMRLLGVLLRDPRDVLGLVRAKRRGTAAATAVPSWCLVMIGTDPEHQGRGVGRRLLQHMLARADADGTPVWLETSEPGNAALYQRFGFQAVTHAPAGRVLPPWWIMRRIPDDGEA